MKCMKLSSYRSLHHVHSITSNLIDITLDVNGLFIFDHLQHGIHYNECSSPANSSTAVHQQRRTRGRVRFMNARNKGGNVGLVIRHSMIWPGSEVVLGHTQGWVCVIIRLPMHIMSQFMQKLKWHATCVQHAVYMISATINTCMYWTTNTVAYTLVSVNLRVTNNGDTICWSSLSSRSLPRHFVSLLPSGQ